jgi:hypothetical protein
MEKWKLKSLSSRTEIFSVQMIHFQDVRKKIGAINFARPLKGN